MKQTIKTRYQMLFILIAITFNLMMVIDKVVGQEHSDKTSMQKPDHVLLSPENIHWESGPPSIPAGAKFTVIDGDPKAQGLFTMRLWLPAGFKIPAHWHPADEHVTVISGTFQMGLGDAFDEAKLTPLHTGSFAVMAAKTKHYAMASEETIVQLHGMGPWGINYVNPADDPRKKQ